MVNMTDTLTAQYSVLGALLISPELVGETISKVPDADFTDGKCRLVYQAMRKLFTSGEPVDPVTIRDKLGGPVDGEWTKYLMGLMEVTPTAANIWEYIKIMREQARLSRINQLGGLLQVCSDSDHAQALAAQLAGEMVDRPGIRCVTMTQALTDFYERHRARHQYLTWGFVKLNDRLYVDNGDFVVLGGYPSAGKSALALAFAWHMATQKKKVGFFSLETNDGKLYDRLVSTVVQMDMGKIKRSELDDADYASITGMAADLTAPTLDLIDAALMTVEDIQSFSLSRGYDVIFIDYLQLIPSPGHNRTEDVTRISLGLHQMAQGNSITVVALSQLSRPETGKDGKKAAPTMASLRESGQIEQDADVVMLLYEEEPGSQTRVLKIAKNKEGERGKLLLDFDGARQTFRPAEGDSQSVAAQYSAIGKKIKQQDNANALAQQVAIDEDPWKDEKK